MGIAGEPQVCSFFWLVRGGFGLTHVLRRPVRSRLHLGPATRCLGETPLILTPWMSYAQPLFGLSWWQVACPVASLRRRFRRSSTSGSRGTTTTCSRFWPRPRSLLAFDAFGWLRRLPPCRTQEQARAYRRLRHFLRRVLRPGFVLVLVGGGLTRSDSWPAALVEIVWVPS